MRGVVVQSGDFQLAFDEILGIVEVTIIGWHPVVLPHVLGLSDFLARDQRFVEFLAMAGTDHPNRVITLEQFLQGDGQHFDSGCRRLLHENVTLPAMLEGMQHQIDGIFQRHQEPGHARVGDGERLAFPELAHEQRNHGAARGHDIAIAGGAQHGIALALHARLGHHQLLHHGLGKPHGVDGVHRLVGAQHDNPLDVLGDGRIHDILGAEHVGLDRFHRIKLAGRNLLQRCCVKNVIHAFHRIVDAVVIPYIANVELELGSVQRDAHILLLLLVTTEDADFADIGFDEALEHGIAKGAGTAGDHQGLVGKHGIERIGVTGNRACAGSAWAMAAGYSRLPIGNDRHSVIDQ